MSTRGMLCNFKLKSNRSLLEEKWWPKLPLIKATWNTLFIWLYQGRLQWRNVSPSYRAASCAECSVSSEKPPLTTRSLIAMYSASFMHSNVIMSVLKKIVLPPARCLGPCGVSSPWFWLWQAMSRHLDFPVCPERSSVSPSTQHSEVKLSPVVFSLPLTLNMDLTWLSLFPPEQVLQFPGARPGYISHSKLRNNFDFFTLFP